jgi:hypothetical protein
MADTKNTMRADNQGAKEHNSAPVEVPLATVNGHAGEAESQPPPGGLEESC